MNKNLIFKEWKEKSWVLLFALFFLVLFVFLASILDKREDIMVPLTAGIQFFLLPLIGILLGASAFSAEFKDNSWAYLFSRPIKKSTIWISKFIAGIGLLAGIMTIYYLALPLIPGFRGWLAEFSAWGVSVLLSLCLYIVAFSLSFLSEKQILVFFATLFIFFAFLIFPSLLLRILPPAPASHSILSAIPLFPLIGGLGVLAFAAASLYAFCRTDFSQSQSKFSGFFKALFVFLMIGAVIGGGAAIIGKRILDHQYLRSNRWDREIPLFFTTGGIFRYNIERDALAKLAGRGFLRAYFSNGVTNGEGKVAWIKTTISGSRKNPLGKQELWVMDAKGQDKRAVFETSKNPNDPFFGRAIYGLDISPNGQKLIIISFPETPSGKKTVWSMNADGTDLRDHPIDFQNIAWLTCLKWSSDSQRAFFAMAVKEGDDKSSITNRMMTKYFTLSLDSGEWSALPEDISGISLFGFSPHGNQLGYFGTSSPEAQMSGTMIHIFNTEAHVTTDLMTLPTAQIACWHPSEDKFAFLADSGRRLGIVSVPEKTILAERTLDKDEIESRIPWTMTWTADGQNIALTDLKNSVYVLRVFDQALLNEKSYPIPQGKKSSVNLPHLYAAGKKLLVFDSPSNRLWSFDPSTEKWKKLF